MTTAFAETRRLEDRRIGGFSKPKVTNRNCFDSEDPLDPARERWGQLCVEPDGHEARSGSDEGMPEASTGQPQAGGDVVGFEVGQLGQDLLA